MIHTEFLLYQAKSFYNAYIALDQVYQASDDPMLYYVPLMVYGAFSAEITLKAILAENGVEYGKEHNLLELYRMLPESYGAELLGHLFEKAPEYRDTDKCVEELVLISNAFVDWRYAYEGQPAPAFDMRFLSAFANAAIWTMLSHYNVDIIPSSTKRETDAEIEEKYRQNREKCIEANLIKIQQKKKKDREKPAVKIDKA